MTRCLFALIRVYDWTIQAGSQYRQSFKALLMIALVVENPTIVRSFFQNRVHKYVPDEKAEALIYGHLVRLNNIHPNTTKIGGHQWKTYLNTYYILFIYVDISI